VSSCHPSRPRRITDEEFEQARERQQELRDQIDRCRGLLERSRTWVGFQAEPFRNALSCSLELLGADPLEQTTDELGKPVWRFPSLDRRAASDPSWAATLDTLRAPRPTGQKLTDWRREAPIRPIVFEDQGVITEETVHLHLEQRVAQRLLARFRAQGFIYNDISRACLVQVSDSIPRVILFGRVSLYGRGAERLHEELVAVAARWSEPDRREGALQAYAREAERRSLGLLYDSFGHGAHQPPHPIANRLLESSAQDVAELLPQLERRADEVAAEAREKLHERGRRESALLHETLVSQRARVREQLERHRREFEQLTLGFAEDDRRQIESNMRSWVRRLTQFDRDLESEPGRIADFYEVMAKRTEPVGLVYLWPDTN
jgi:hypothetical protein